MKTLKQQIIKQLDLSYKQLDNFGQIAEKLVKLEIENRKEWLTQKRQFYKEILPKGLATVRGIMIFDELLSELKEDSQREEKLQK